MNARLQSKPKKTSRKPSLAKTSRREQLDAPNRIVLIEFVNAKGVVAGTLLKPAVEAKSYVASYNRCSIDSGLKARVQPRSRRASPDDRYDLVVLKNGKLDRLIARFLTREEAVSRARVFNSASKTTPFREKVIRIECLPPFVWHGE
jgi:hypothetical protein